MIAGIDPSLASFGIAMPDGILLTLKEVKIPVRPADDEMARRLHWMAARFSRALAVHPPRPLLAVIEGYAPGSKGIQSTLRLAELGGIVRLRLFELGVAIKVVNPQQLKRFACGNGMASKDQMVGAARALGADPANHDEADAFLLRQLGRCAYGLEEPHRPEAKEIMASTRWPTLPAPVR